MFKDNIFAIKRFIDPLAELPEETLRSKVVNKIVDKKLERNYNSYVEEVTSKINYILSRNNYRVIKAVNRMKAEEIKKREENDESDDVDYE